MKPKVSILISILMILSVMPLTFADSKENVAIIVSTPADAVVAAPYAKAMGYKLIYTPSKDLSEDAKRTLEIEHINKVIIVGGPVAVSNNVENKLKLDLKIKTERVWGETRVETSAKLFERWVKEDPKIAEKVVLAEGFNEKIIPVAVGFDAPVLYYAPNKAEIAINTLKTLNVKIDKAVILGTEVPKEVKEVSKISKTVMVASDKDPAKVIKTAISFAKEINPEISKKSVAVVAFEKTNNPIINAILEFVKGNVGSIVPIPTEDDKSISNIISGVISINTNVNVFGESSTIMDKVVNVITKVSKSEGATVSVSTTTGVTPVRHVGSSGGSATTSTTPPTKTATLNSVTLDGNSITLNTSEGIKTANVSYSSGNKTIIAEKIKEKTNDTIDSLVDSMVNDNNVYPVNATLSGGNIKEGSDSWLVGLWNSITKLFIGIIHAVLGDGSVIDDTVVYNGNLAGNIMPGNYAGNLAGNIMPGNYAGNLAGNLAPLNSQ
ncbi:cell wall-binding repeat-containing protein [Methanotorris formicicus]|uniref:Cell wall binding repeat 2-containing protein n=1 Tax=Methanotorris formicicus Mc-S-70 TaxID=647171 RepID=H1KX99_9EURY|nr:cell wall-binding repeat-containing protein [Methanotorris formicicus]EHP88530.1 cell wall binding repeat 2-containing protein [Methanotorris formicicus Mc-S-70]